MHWCFYEIQIRDTVKSSGLQIEDIQRHFAFQLLQIFAFSTCLNIQINSWEQVLKM